MNSIENRLMRIKRFSQEQIGKLHDTERESGKDWLIAGTRFICHEDKMMGLYWESGKDFAEQAREVDLFINCHAVKKAFAKMLSSPDTTEMEDIHSADWSVWKEAPMPNTGKGSSDNKSRLAALYSKAEPRKTPYEDL